MKTVQLPQASRSNLQLGRRFFHVLSGILAGTLYNLFVTHSQAVNILGGIISAIYLLEQIRIHYPEISNRFQWINRYLLRAEEHLKESAMMPFAIGILLVILTFPKPAAVIAIYAVALADPLSAIIGIQFGSHKIVGKKTVEGSTTFFITTFLIVLGVLLTSQVGTGLNIFWTALFVGFVASAIELIPLRLDDNFTIPIYTALLTWIFSLFFGLTL